MVAKEDDGAKTRKKFSDLLARVLGAVIVVGTLVFSMWLSSVLFVVLICIVSGLCAFEFYRAVQSDEVAIFKTAGIPASASMPFIAYYAGWEYLQICLVILLFLCFLRFLIYPVDRPTPAIGLTFLGVFITGYLMSYLTLLLRLDTIEWTPVFTLMVIIWIYDTVAYFGGSAVGKRRMIPHISPNKSWEGTVIGSLAAFIAAYVMFVTVSRDWLNLPVAFIMAGIVMVAGPIGDLSESLIKRDVGVKDMSELIPGHGGFLDRFDSTLFSAAFCYIFLYYFVF